MRSLLLIAPVLFAACTSSSGSGDDEEIVNCTTETRADNFSIGLEKPGGSGAVDFHLMTAMPAPPAQGNNTWEVQLNTMNAGVAGDPMVGATLGVHPYMPDHMHPAELKAVVTDEGNGLYKMTPVNLWMPGLWQTTIDVTPPGASEKTDSVVFSFCIPN